ncbi:HPr family phosphocarrier protein [Priestia megaterium]|uniref:HPr family phosphocarrier protein n=1 Tax=Priestia megaterium TaxID=1404 RepID=UPI0033912168
MTKKLCVVGLKAGLQARKASQFVQLASTFDSEIKVIKDEKTIEAKSIMGIMSIGIREGDEITLSVKGEEEQKALITLENFLLNVE